MPYYDYAVKLQPAWLRDTVGTALTECLGLAWDVVVDAARLAVKARFVELAPSDALPYIASERRLEAMPAEAESSWRARLGAAWTTWVWAGTEQGLLGALTLLGFTNVSIKYSWNWPQYAAPWNHFWIVIAQPHSFGTAPKWGAFSYGDGSIYGISNTTPAQLEQIRRIVRLWKPAHAVCRGIIIQLTGHTYGDGWHYGDGTTWGGQQATLSL